MCAAAKSDKDVYVESGIERATSVSPQARLCVFNACEPIKAKGFAEMVKVFSLEVRARRPVSMRVVSLSSLSCFGPRRGRRGAFMKMASSRDIVIPRESTDRFDGNAPRRKRPRIEPIL